MLEDQKHGEQDDDQSFATEEFDDAVALPSASAPLRALSRNRSSTSSFPSCLRFRLSARESQAHPSSAFFLANDSRSLTSPFIDV